MECCVLCKEDDGKLNVVYKKGYKSLLRACRENDQEEQLNELSSLQRQGERILVHPECRKSFVDCRKNEKEVRQSKRLKSVDGSFDWKKLCFLCGNEIDFKRKKDLFRQVRTIEFHQSLVKSANERGDEWGKDVLFRLESCFDLVAAEAVYHRDCAANFRHEVNNTDRGRPVDSKAFQAFENLCKWLENSGDCEIYTINYLYEKMVEEGETVYCLKRFRQKLKKRYQDHVYFVPSEGCKGELVCFRKMSDYILRNLKENGAISKENVISAAAKMIKEDIREMDLNKDFYPSVADIKSSAESDNFVPETLQMFMKYLMNPVLKRQSIAQCIVQASRSKSCIQPIPFGLGVEIDKTIGSKWLITHLSRLGFCISYDEVQKFKQSAIVHADNQSDAEDICEAFAQWIADNVDHDINTLTGKGTFHGMGIICANSAPIGDFGKVSRLRKIPATSFKNRGVEIIPYQKSAKSCLSSVRLNPIPFKRMESPMGTFNLLWHSAWLLSSPNKHRPNWSGFMQCSTKRKEEITKPTNITFLPIIDLNPSDETCIYSTLKFVIAQAKKLNVKTPCITFDQPLWLKATGIIHEENLPIVCKLGGFHTLMSFLGSIGNMMEGSGLEDLFSEVYAENSVTHIFSGKAIARALRAHILAESVLTSLLLVDIKEKKEIEFIDLQKYYEKALSSDLDTEKLIELNSDTTFNQIRKELEITKNQLKEQSRTVQLWIEYMDYIDIVKNFIYAERTSNWELHLSSLSKMLNLFAATGHINYAKCGRLYLQNMEKLPEKQQWLHDQFMSGNHTVQRTSKHWTGIWTDLAIEQTLMRSLKTKGGLTGRGMNESVRHQWVLSLSHTAQIHDAMSQLTGAVCKTSEQHHELGVSRTKQDYNHCLKMLEWISTRNPFLVPGQNLQSISTGLVSNSEVDNVNCEQAEVIGAKIQKNLDNKLINDASIKRNDQLKSLASLRNNISKNGSERLPDPKALFHRMVTIAEREENLQQFFRYELTAEPMSLFKEGMMRKPDKPSLRKVIMSEEDAMPKKDIAANSHFVIDGGALLHRVRWQKGDKFISIADTYIKYVKKHYGNSAEVIFDGYEDESIKSQEHKRRNIIPQSCDVKIQEENPVPFTQDRFLSNTLNKAGLINFLSIKLQQANIEVTNCPGDADSTIAKITLDKSKSTTTVAVADDTDIAVMLVHHWDGENHLDVYFLQERWDKAWNIKHASLKNKFTKEHLLFLHAFTGCDTTSSIFGKGKANILNMCIKSEYMKEQAEIISCPWSEQSEVGSAAIEIFKMMYNGKKNDSLSRMRYQKYTDLACKGIVAPEKLPPTEKAAHFHGLRCHYQIIEWSMIDNFDIQPSEWGWKLENGALIPVMTDEEIAPQSLMKVIRCKCKLGTKNPCGSKACSCRKYGVHCVSSCGECQGIECSNATKISTIDDDDDHDSDYEEDTETTENNNIFDILSNI